VEKIFHIADIDDFNKQISSGQYVAASLETEGFIHCSQKEQLRFVREKFFKGATNLLLLEIDPSLLSAKLVYETADGQSFPHIYGSINSDAIVNTTNLDMA
jgi:uncharacterized protein (DUF952 family)